MAQQLKHTSVPRPFESGDIMEWLNLYEICAKANGWDAAVKAVNLLEGEVLGKLQRDTHVGPWVSQLSVGPSVA